MPIPLAVVLDEIGSVREEAKRLLSGTGIDVVAVATPREASDVLRAHPHAVVVAMPEGSTSSKRLQELATLCRLRAAERADVADVAIEGRSEAATALRLRLHELADSQRPVLFAGERGSGRSHAARCLHALSNGSGGFLVVPADDPAGLAAALSEQGSTVYVPALEQVTWSGQDQIAELLSSGTGSVRLMASTADEPLRASVEGLLSPSLFAAFHDGLVRIPPLRERSEDIGLLARAFVEELRRLNGLPPIVIAEPAIAALETFAWPGNVRQLRNAIESVLTLLQDGTLRVADLPEFLRGGAGPLDSGARADRRFRDAKRTVVEAFERAYLEELLRRHGGNVTGAAEQAGMLRSALQRLLRKHDLHSADFRRRGGPDRYAS